jgi:pilus assembly protein CpaE
MGATTLVTQAASILAQREPGKQRICLIDLDIQGQAAGLYVNVDSPLSVIDCLTEPERIDAMLMKSVVTRHKVGFDMMPAPKAMMPLDRIRPAAVEALLEVARSEYDLIFLDMPPAWTAWSETALASSDLLVLVTQVSVPGVYHARRQIAALSEHKLGTLPMLVVANRYQKRMFGRGLRLQDAERGLGRKIDASVCSDYSLVSEALNAGVPASAVKRRTRFERDIHKLMTLALGRLREPTMGEPAATKLTI